MPVTDTAATEKVYTALGGEPEGTTRLELANAAGDLLMSLRAWRWARELTTGASQLDLTQDQEYVWLPTDLRSVLRVDLIGETSTQLYATSWAELLEMRARDLVPSTTPAWYVIAHAADATDNNRLRPRLELHPTPTTTVSPGVYVYYTKEFTYFTTTDTGAEAPIPKWLDMIYLQLIAAVARGWEDDLDGPGMESVYVQQVLQSNRWLAALDRDSQIQPTIGPVRTGFLDTPRTWGPYVPPVQL